ncbi:N-acetyltransferase B complex non catalytic subunit-domain-containing protein [Xylaria venustula]|nr:N-acetyltransferase B complex non catalytic subunit-domain-containing protein [Xylaria venustula]
MTYLRIRPGPPKFHLRNDVDGQLQRLFSEEKYAKAAVLARQRYRTTNDEIYKALEMIAKTHSDNATDLIDSRETLQAILKETNIKDIYLIDICETAAGWFHLDYTDMIGVLRSKLVKALPKDQIIGRRCFERCMYNSDWDNAQEIAVSLNKNFPGDRNLLFRNILTTFLIAGSDDAPEYKKKLFPNLAKAQVDRAFNLRPPTGKEKTPPAQIELKLGEISLWMQIRTKFGSPQENLMLLSRPDWGPLFFLDRGLKEAFLASIELLRSNEHWEEIVRVTNIILDKVITFEKEDKHHNHHTDLLSITQQVGDNADAVKRHYKPISRDFLLWMHVLEAIQHVPNSQQALDTFYKKTEELVPFFNDEAMSSEVFRKNYDLILLDMIFARARIVTDSSYDAFYDESKETKKTTCLLNFATKYRKSPSCVPTLMLYIKTLSREEVTVFLDLLGVEYLKSREEIDLFERLFLIVLRLRVRFFQATSLKAGEECRVCHALAKKDNLGSDCQNCLQDILTAALDAFSLGIQDEGVSQKAAQETDGPLASLAVLGALCLIKLAGVGYRTWKEGEESPLYNTDIQLFLQAVVWLDFYLRKAPRNSTLRILLVKLYIKMGCVTRASHIWDAFDVKNHLLECLGSICLDRLATVSPAHFIAGQPYAFHFTEPLISHFEEALQRKYPDAVLKTLEYHNYAQIPDIIKLAQDQSHNCVSILAIVEHRRGIRLHSNRNGDTIQNEPLIGSLSPDYELRDNTDYNPLPHWMGDQSTPIQELVSLGPLPTNRRCHLSILAEHFLDLVSYTQPKECKYTKASQVLPLDWQAAVSSCNDLHKNLDTLLMGQTHKDMDAFLSDHIYDEHDLTRPESLYFRIVYSLTDFVKLVLQTIARHVSLPPDSFVLLVSPPKTPTPKGQAIACAARIIQLLNHQTRDFLALPDGMPTKIHTFHGVASLHAMGMLRESSHAIKTTVQYISIASERLKVAEKSGEDFAWLSHLTEKISRASATADTHMKDRVKSLTESLHASGWVDRLESWVFSDTAVLPEYRFQFSYAELGDLKKEVASKLGEFIPASERENWAIEVADSWRDVIKGWCAVRFD